MPSTKPIVIQRPVVEELEREQLAAPVILIYQDDLNEINKCLGFNCANLDQLKQRISSLNSIRIDDAEIRLPLALLQRLKSRAGRVELGQYLRETVIRQLNSFVGM